MRLSFFISLSNFPNLQEYQLCSVGSKGFILTWGQLALHRNCQKEHLSSGVDHQIWRSSTFTNMHIAVVQAIIQDNLHTVRTTSPNCHYQKINQSCWHFFNNQQGHVLRASNLLYLNWKTIALRTYHILLDVLDFKKQFMRLHMQMRAVRAWAYAPRHMNAIHKSHHITYIWCQYAMFMIHT